MPTIFISYRRGTTNDITYRICEHLRQHFGAERVYLDIDNVPLGARFPDHLARTLDQCQVVLAIIGKDWGFGRLKEDGDLLRQELELALERGVVVIPILVHGAPLPAAADLPPSLFRLLDYNAVAVDSGRDFQPHMQYLVRAIEDHLRASRQGPSLRGEPRALGSRFGSPHDLKSRHFEVPAALVVAALGASALAVGGAIYWFQRPLIRSVSWSAATMPSQAPIASSQTGAGGAQNDAAGRAASGGASSESTDRLGTGGSTPVGGSPPVGAALAKSKLQSGLSIPAGKVRMGAVTVSGRLPPEVIQRITRQNFGRFRMCYEQGLGRKPTLQGRVSARFVIGRDGSVSNVSNGGSDLPDSRVVSCVLSAFYGLAFPQPEGGIVTVVYPIVLTPG